MRAKSDETLLAEMYRAGVRRGLAAAEVVSTAGCEIR